MVTRSNDSPTSLISNFEHLVSSSLVPSSELGSDDSIHPPIIILDVAGRTFKVSVDILIASSGFFQRQLSARFNWTPQRDGTYFLDADPELFEHLLRFMRRPSIFPLFWAKDRGFDYNLYQRLQAEAGYFKVFTLYQWIMDKRYLDAITIHTHLPQVCELDDISHDTMAANISEERFYTPKVHKTYVCPRGIVVHYGKRDACGRACRDAQGDDDTDYDEEDYIEVVSVRSEIVFDEKVCQVG
ncbi:hypothetical protein OPT61_g488 [Boeremia exigua]|uniref:Uncharacterized protein n=1 Tax=Boeremia exigua TaxID=749465 RepID=A0ACC2IU15_9PLEO|nr:hypothetical protein OPT61_g488 [Boeremia exigua]